MKAGRSEVAEDVEIRMTPMIDVVFQLLVFFLFTFDIVAVEGEIAVDLSEVRTGAAAQPLVIDVVEKVRLRLIADEAGRLREIRAGSRSLGSDPAELARFLRENFVDVAPSPDDVRVEIDADAPLRYHFLMRCVNAALRAGVRRIDLADST